MIGRQRRRQALAVPGTFLDFALLELRHTAASADKTTCRPTTVMGEDGLAPHTRIGVVIVDEEWVERGLRPFAGPSAFSFGGLPAGAQCAMLPGNSGSFAARSTIGEFSRTVRVRPFFVSMAQWQGRRLARPTLPWRSVFVRLARGEGTLPLRASMARDAAGDAEIEIELMRRHYGTLVMKHMSQSVQASTPA